MTNFEFFSRLLLAIFVISLYVLFVYILASYKDHISIYNVETKDIKFKSVLELYRSNHDRFLFIDLDPGFMYELICTSTPRLIIHFYRTSIEVLEGSHVYYYSLGIFDFIVYQIYYFIIFRFTTKKPGITIENLKGRKGIAR